MDIINFLADVGLDPYYVAILSKNALVIVSIWKLGSVISKLTKSDKDDKFWAALKEQFSGLISRNGKE